MSGIIRKGSKKENMFVKIGGDGNGALKYGILSAVFTPFSWYSRCRQVRRNGSYTRRDPVD